MAHGYEIWQSVKACVNLYEALVRSVLEYGVVVWNSVEWDEGERIQREMGRRILEDDQRSCFRRTGVVEASNKKGILEIEILDQTHYDGRYETNSPSLQAEPASL